MEGIGDVDERLGGNTADIQAGSPEVLLLDQDSFKPKLPGADRGDITAGSAADDENARAQGFGHRSLVQTSRIPGESRDPFVRQRSG
jgi:hypothetical protein